MANVLNDKNIIANKYYKKVTDLDEEIRKMENNRKRTQQTQETKSKTVIPIETKTGMTISNMNTQRVINSTYSTTLGTNSYYKRVTNLDSDIEKNEKGLGPMVSQPSFEDIDDKTKEGAKIIRYESILKEKNIELGRKKKESDIEVSKTKEKQPRSKKEKVKKLRVKKEKAKKFRVKKEKIKQPKARKEKAQIIKDSNRLTEPKKRNFFKRIILQMEYGIGKYEFIEDEYLKGEIMKEELDFSNNSEDIEDRNYYQEVQEYEDMKDDVSFKRGWMAFKLGLATALLAGSLAVSKNMIQEIKNDISVMQNNEEVEISLENLTQEQLDIIKEKISSIKTSSQYNFENLTENEQLLAVLKLEDTEENISARTFETKLLKNKDQEFLEEIVYRALGDEFLSYSEEKKFDLKKLAFELLSEEKKEHLRDPLVIRQIQERQQNRSINDEVERD